jgi:hypothetical protein
MELTDLPPAPQPETFQLEGTYSEKDIRSFSAFLAKRVAGTKLWALGIFILLPLFYSGNLRQTWPLMAPIGLVLIGFIFLLRFVILPNKLYKAATRLPGIFDPRCIILDTSEVDNRSEAGGHRFRLEDVKEVVETPDYLFVMVTPKQGIPIPKAWLGGKQTQGAVVERLLSRRVAR